MNNIYSTYQPYKKRGNNQRLRDTISDALKIVLIFLVVIIIGCIRANS